MGVFTCPACQKTMMGTCGSCGFSYCNDCYNWHCNPELFPPRVRANVRLVLSLPRCLTFLLMLALLSVSLCLTACSYDDPGSLSLVGSPTVTVDFINQVLANHASPAKGSGQSFYDNGVKSGVDPAFALAFFAHESGFGRSGEATKSLSIGNIRCLPDFPCEDGFAQFSSWSAGIQSWNTLVSGPLYVGAGLTTLQSVIHRYAPGDSESVYVQAVGKCIQSWRSGQDC